MTTSVPSISTFTNPSVTAPFDPAQNPSKAAAYWLRRDIVRGVFAPLERLKVEKLVGFYSLGHSPIREAILIVSASGLVVHEHQKGYRVAPVSLADYTDVLEVYQRLYKVALEVAVEIGDDAWEERVVVQLHRAVKVRMVTLEDEPQARERWQRAYWEFHGELLSGCGSPLMIQLLGDIGFRLERYVNLFADLESDRIRDHAAEHRQIVDALIARDKARVLAHTESYFAMAQPMRNSIIAALREQESQPIARRRAVGRS
jgi:GntR family carbon starvation induced transcriptional regulator